MTSWSASHRASPSRARELAQQKRPGWTSYAVVDESLLIDTIEGGEVTLRTVQRLAGYVVAAAEAGATCEIFQFLCERAFARLRAGDTTAHNHSVREGFAALAADADLVVLAQASMADAIEGTSQTPFLTSPEIGMEHVAQQLAAV